MLPVKYKKYFWDCSYRQLKWENHKKFISERILNFGDFESVDWLRKRLLNSELSRIIKTSKNINDKTKNYWKIILGND